MQRRKGGNGKERIEEIGTFKYLGFVFNRKGNYNDHIKEDE